MVWLGRETCKKTWEPADRVPASIVNEFEGGAVCSTKEFIGSSGVGQKTHTLIVEKNNHSPPKSRIVVEENKGYVILTWYQNSY